MMHFFPNKPKSAYFRHKKTVQTMRQKQKWSAALREKALSMGFEAVGFARAEKMDPEARRLEEWLSMGSHGSMKWMENHFDLRTDPTQLVPGAKTVVSLAYNYYTEKKQSDPSAPKIAKYALGEDYHHVLRKKLKNLLQWMREEIGEVQGRCFVDSGPVMERDWAARSGIAWNGKNTLSIRPGSGSWFFLAELIIDLELEYDHPIKDHCGTCRRCVDACPTEAFSPNGYLLDASRCISYLTIELRDEIPNSFKGQMEGYAFGCDICQEVCPWNRFAHRHSEPAFEPSPALLGMGSREWQEMTSEVFDEVFKRSPVKRTRLEGLKRNIRFLKQPDEGQKI
jgi:epoxyqueuosine reductase